MQTRPSWGISSKGPDHRIRVPKEAARQVLKAAGVPSAYARQGYRIVKDFGSTC